MGSPQFAILCPQFQAFPEFATNLVTDVNTAETPDALQCGMRQIQVLLPFGLPPLEFATDLWGALQTPALSTLVARAKASPSREFDPFARALPHEIWLAGQPDPSAGDTSPALAPNRMRALRLQPDDGYWFLLHPVHIHVARDHLVLTDQRRTVITETEARALFETALPLFRQAGKELLYGDARTWFVRADAWRTLQTATPDAACGHNVDIWMPKGTGERDWRKLQNEVQMEWHEHAVNAERARHRLPPINSLWLWGGGDAGDIGGKAAAPPAISAPAYASAYADLAALQAQSPDTRILVADQLIEAALAEDWAAWLDALHTIERNWCMPLLQALRAGQLAQVDLLLGHHLQLREFVVRRSSLRKFWVKPALTRLLP
jgi:hypothetical protein